MKKGKLIAFLFFLTSFSPLASAGYESPFRYSGSENSRQLNQNIKSDLSKFVSIFSKEKSSKGFELNTKTELVIAKLFKNDKENQKAQ